MPSLPIDAIRGHFVDTLKKHHVLVEAPTGSGKSTRLPLWCREAGRVLIVEPRRLACRSLARYLARSLGEPPGESIGYAVRFESCYQASTPAVFCTPGVALRWHANNNLADFQVVLLDEFHERRWDTDLLAALLKAQAQHRLVITSATIEAQRLATYFDAQHLRAEGRMYPVSVSYRDDADLPRLKKLDQRVVDGVKQALHQCDHGDVLVFLPGRGEIAELERSLRGVVSHEIIPLHASVPNATQDKALTAADKRRIILATNVAETSLTLPGVRAVVDSGLERRSHHRNGRTVLGLHCISQASAEQRRGRAGRLAEGLCIRLWSKAARLEPSTPPEILREELDELLLAAAASTSSIQTLLAPGAFPEKLPQHAVDRAWQRLQAMQALDGNGNLTDHGKRLFPLPLEPLFAHLITAMPDDASRCAMVDLSAALMSDQPIYGYLNEAEREQLRQWLAIDCDAATLIEILRKGSPEDVSINAKALNQSRTIANQVRQSLELPPLKSSPDYDRRRLLQACLQAVPELAYIRRAKRKQAMGNGIDEVEISAGSRFSDHWEAAVVFDQHSIPGKGTLNTINRATCMAPITLDMISQAGLGQIHYRYPRWEKDRPIVEVQRVYADRIIDTQISEPRGDALHPVLATLILHQGLMAPVGENLRNAVDAWNLYCQLDTHQGDAVNAHTWLARRLKTLGVSQTADLDLIEADDLAFEGIPEAERQAFESAYPRRLQLENCLVDVEYQPKKKAIILHYVEGSRHSPPLRKWLPRWPGWKLYFQYGKRINEILR